MPNFESWEPRKLTTVTDGPQSETPNIMRLKEKGSQIRMSEEGHRFALTKNVRRGFLSRPVITTQGAVKQP